ncbi:hypothetical protein CCP2SC5_450005 [Azospirillaceae bacterium]
MSDRIIRDNRNKLRKSFREGGIDRLLDAPVLRTSVEAYSQLMDLADSVDVRLSHNKKLGCDAAESMESISHHPVQDLSPNPISRDSDGHFAPDVEESLFVKRQPSSIVASSESVIESPNRSDSARDDSVASVVSETETLAALKNNFQLCKNSMVSLNRSKKNKPAS